MRNANLMGVSPRTALYESFPGTFLYIGLHKRGSANLKVPIITNIPDAPAELTMTGTEDYATNIWPSVGIDRKLRRTEFSEIIHELPLNVCLPMFVA